MLLVAGSHVAAFRENPRAAPGGISYGKARSFIEQEAEERKKLLPPKV